MAGCGVEMDRIFLGPPFAAMITLAIVQDHAALPRASRLSISTCTEDLAPVPSLNLMPPSAYICSIRIAASARRNAAYWSRIQCRKRARLVVLHSWREACVIGLLHTLV
ncbi:hypothetical protein GGE09_002289 [Roseobacter sp. N2S]|nr:hypothetical protein [Roseobacter sp. N2S]